MSDAVSRRGFLGTAGGMAVLPVTARSYGRIPGANSRIQIGQIGCGHRAFGLRRMLKLSSKTDPNFDLRSVCDIWTVNMNRAADHAKELFGTHPKTYKYSEDLLADAELDAVMVATGDHQHAKMLVEVVRAGKDCYCEKPMANTLADAKLARDTVKASRQVVQMGSQWLSCPYQRQVREIIRGGKLGKITRIEQSWNFNGPRWRVPNDPNIADIQEKDTDWNRWLAGRPYTPFDRRAYFEFRIYRGFSGGITDQWYSHGSGLAHFYLDYFIPDSTVAHGGIFAWHDGRENPDTFACLSTFEEKEVLYSFSVCFGNGYGNHTIIRGMKGTLYSPGGEGSPQWWYLPETRSGWRSNLVFNLPVRSVKPELVTIPGHTEAPPVEQSDDLSYHTDDWFRCMRSRTSPNGSIETGFAHSVAVVMATQSYREGKKTYWDRKNEEILDRPPSA